MRYRSLAVGPGNMYGVKLSMGISEIFVQRFGILQSRFISGTSYLLKTGSCLYKYSNVSS